jgi:hypothetical protein
MKELQIGKHHVLIYDSIDELPIRRFHKFNRYVLIDSGIGSDLNDINVHINRIAQYMTSDLDKGRIELENLRQSLYLISEEINPKHLSFAVLVHSIDAKRVLDLSDDNMAKVINTLGDVKKTVLDRLIEMVKKKIETELRQYFPRQFDDVAVKDYFDRLKSRILLQLDTLIRGNDNRKKIQEIDDFLLSLANPKVFAGKESAEIKYTKQFEEMCLFLKKELSLDADNLSTLQFYNAFDFIKKNSKSNGR